MTKKESEPEIEVRKYRMESKMNKNQGANAMKLCEKRTCIEWLKILRYKIPHWKLNSIVYSEIIDGKTHRYSLCYILDECINHMENQ